MAILKEVEFPLAYNEIVPVMEYFKSLYEGKIDNAEAAQEFGQVTNSLLSGHVPVVLEKVYDFITPLLKIIPDLKGYLDLVPERTNHFIGWMSYAYTGELDRDTLAGWLNDALADYSGPVVSNAVFSSTHHQNGIVFTSIEVEPADAEAYFEDMLNQYNSEDDDDDSDGEDCPFDQ